MKKVKKEEEGEEDFMDTHMFVLGLSSLPCEVIKEKIVKNVSLEDVLSMSETSTHYMNMTRRVREKMKDRYDYYDSFSYNDLLRQFIESKKKGRSGEIVKKVLKDKYSKFKVFRVLDIDMPSFSKYFRAQQNGTLLSKHKIDLPDQTFLLEFFYSPSGEGEQDPIHKERRRKQVLYFYSERLYRDIDIVIVDGIKKYLPREEVFLTFSRYDLTDINSEILFLNDEIIDDFNDPYFITTTIPPPP